MIEDVLEGREHPDGQNDRIVAPGSEQRSDWSRFAHAPRPDLG